MKETFSAEFNAFLFRGSQKQNFEILTETLRKNAQIKTKSEEKLGEGRTLFQTKPLFYVE